MTERPWLFASRWLAVLALVAYCLWRSIAAAAAYFGSADAYSYLSAWRSAARDAPSGRLALLCADVHSISPVERSRMVAMSWERAPSPIDVIDQSSDLEPVNCVLSSVWHPASIGRRLESCGFSAVSTNEYVKTWSRASDPRHIPCRRPLDASIHGASIPREVAALAVELLLLLIAFALVFSLRGITWWKLIAPVVVAFVLGAVALSHPLLAPNGLGVYGGKAKLLCECGGMPGEFLDSAGGMALQPSYPPGLTLLAYFHFALSGGCGDRLVQLLVVFAVAALCFAMLRRAERPLDALPVALFCLSPVSVRMTSGFYAEPFAALMLLLGWNAICRGSLLVGAFALGFAGMFRLEAGVVAAIFALGACCVRGDIRGKVFAIALSVAPTVVWVTASRLLGYGRIADWNFCIAPNLGHVPYAVWCEARSLGMFVVPIAVLAFLARPFAKPCLSQDLAMALVSMALLLSVIPLACSFHTSPHARWMMNNTIPRLLWYVSAVPLAVLVQRDSRLQISIRE